MAIVVDEPIVNSPFEEPTRHYRIRDGRTQLTNWHVVQVPDDAAEDYLLIEDVGAKRWIDAVNHWGKLGRWRYAKVRSPYELTAVLGVASAQ